VLRAPEQEMVVVASSSLKKLGEINSWTSFNCDFSHRTLRKDDLATTHSSIVAISYWTLWLL
jgi:hypothetical protein